MEYLVHGLPPDAWDRHQEVIQGGVIQRLVPLRLLAIQESYRVNKTLAYRSLHVCPADSHRVGERQRLDTLTLPGFSDVFERV